MPGPQSRSVVGYLGCALLATAALVAGISYGVPPLRDELGEVVGRVETDRLRASIEANEEVVLLDEVRRAMPWVGASMSDEDLQRLAGAACAEARSGHDRAHVARAVSAVAPDLDRRRALRLSGLARRTCVT